MYNREYAENALKKIPHDKAWHTAYLDEDFRFYVRTELTGHMYYGSPYETCDDCGNCDGARCDYCDIVWIVEDTNEKIHIEKEYDDEDGTHVIIPDDDEFGISGHSIARLRTTTYKQYEGVLEAIEEWLKEHP